MRFHAKANAAGGGDTTGSARLGFDFGATAGASRRGIIGGLTASGAVHASGRPTPSTMATSSRGGLRSG